MRDRHPHTVDGTQYYLMRDFWHDAEIFRIVPTDYELRTLDIIWRSFKFQVVLKQTAADFL